METSAETARWSTRYQTALRRYLRQGESASLLPAQRLGNQAVTLGLKTLELALIHEQAMTTIASLDGTSPVKPKKNVLAKRFFTEAIVPIEKTHSAALKNKVRVNQLTQTLRQRTVESDASTRYLKRGIAQRQTAEVALKKSEKDRDRLLQESNNLKKYLHEQTRELLSAQEDERQKTSIQLQDEIAQILLAVNIRLLALKSSAKTNTDKLENEIANTQRMVRESKKRINRVAHEFDIQHKTQ